MGVSLLTVLAVSTAVQVPQAVVQGMVRDASSGQPLHGAVVLLTDLGRGAGTGEFGSYVLRGVPPGPHHLTASSLGYATRTVHALVPRTGTLEIDIALHAEPIPLEGIEVTPPLPLPGIERGRRAMRGADRSLTMSAVRGHPLLSQNDPLKALSGSEVSMDPEAPAGAHVRGGAADHTAYELDGIPVLNPVHSAGMFAAWNPDALAEIALSAMSPRASQAEALSGVVLGSVREPGDRVGLAGTLSTTHGAMTVHGPWREGPGGYVVSVRSGFPGLVAPSGESSYLRGQTGDVIVKAGTRLLGGDAELLWYGSENEVTGGTVPDPAAEPVSPVDPRGPAPSANAFEWSSRSAGAVWRRTGPSEIEIKTWHAGSDAESAWEGAATPAAVTSARRDVGAQVTVRTTGERSSRQIGVRGLHIRTEYVTALPAAGPPQDGTATVATLFADQSVRVGHGWDARAGASLSSLSGRALVSPRFRLAWIPNERWSASASAIRAHQYTQSLRNPESVTARVFPANLDVVAGSADVPVPRSDQIVVAFTWRPAPGVRFGGQGFARRFEDLALVAPTEGGPFATGSVPTGSGSAQGVSVEASAAGARLGWLASYGWQRVRLRTDADSYIPGHAITHALMAGIVAHPSATWSIRLGVHAQAGRRATDVAGPFEWEACNLLDGGCEFAGNPLLGGEPGERALPAYLRVDVGVRKHWDIRVGERDSVMGLFGTVTNLFGRPNVLAYVLEGDTRPTPIEMLPLAPLVVGLDWRF